MIRRGMRMRLASLVCGKNKGTGVPKSKIVKPVMAEAGGEGRFKGR